MAVHGHDVPPRLDEQVPLEPGKGFDYGRAKVLAERAIGDAFGKGLPAISLRPARIYGPHGKTFIMRPLQALCSGQLVLAGDAHSPANMVYVDNVVHAIVRALEAPETALGQAFLINEPDQSSWLEFYEFFARAAGRHVHVEPRTDTANHRGSWLIGQWFRAGKDVARSAELRALIKKAMWTDPIGVLPRRVWDSSPRLQERVLAALGVDRAVVYREARPPEPERLVFDIAPTLVISDKATVGLGYAPPVAHADAMTLTLDWARWARLL